MRVRLVAYGIARDILGEREMSYELGAGSTIDALKKLLLENHDDFEKLASLSFAVNEEYVPEDYLLKEGDEVVIIPPVSGG